MGDLVGRSLAPHRHRSAGQLLHLGDAAMDIMIFGGDQARPLCLVRLCQQSLSMAAQAFCDLLREG